MIFKPNDILEIISSLTFDLIKYTVVKPFSLSEVAYKLGIDLEKRGTSLEERVANGAKLSAYLFSNGYVVHNTPPVSQQH